MEFIFDLIPAIMGLFWLIFVLSIVSRIVKAAKKAASEQGKGFDQQTVLKRLEEMRKAFEEREATGHSPGSARPAQASTQRQTQQGIPSGGQSGRREGTPPVRRSRFEEYTQPAQLAGTYQEGEAGGEEYAENVSGSLEGTSSENLQESRDKDRYGGLTPFQMELLNSERFHSDSLEGRGSEEAGIWKDSEMCEAWGDSGSAEGGGLEGELVRLAALDEPQHVDLVGGINMNEMADAVVWSEILGRPLSAKRMTSSGARRR